MGQRPVSPHKVPKDFRFTDALPRNALGKTLKPDLVRWVGGLE